MTTIGEILVRHGVLTSDQLAGAAEEQRRTGRPLGEIVVARGLGSAEAVAGALAGWAPAGGEPATARLEAWLALAREAIAVRDAELARLRAALEPSAHLVLSREGERYELVEAEGPPPRVGASVDGQPVLRVLPCVVLSD